MRACEGVRGRVRACFTLTRSDSIIDLDYREYCRIFFPWKHRKYSSKIVNIKGIFSIFNRYILQGKLGPASVFKKIVTRSPAGRVRVYGKVLSSCDC